MLLGGQGGRAQDRGKDAPSVTRGGGEGCWAEAPTIPRRPSSFSSADPSLNRSPPFPPPQPPASYNSGPYLPGPGSLYKILIKCRVVTYRGWDRLCRGCFAPAAEARKMRFAGGRLEALGESIPGAPAGLLGGEQPPPRVPTPAALPSARPRQTWKAASGCGGVPVGDRAPTLSAPFAGVLHPQQPRPARKAPGTHAGFRDKRLIYFIIVFIVVVVISNQTTKGGEWGWGWWKRWLRGHKEPPSIAGAVV